jgi:hypothetical protein
VDDINSIVRFSSGSSNAAPTEQPAPEAPKGDTADKADAAPPAAERTERDEAGRFKSKADEVENQVKEEKAPDKVPAKPEEKPTGQLAALMAERAKRQELERKLAALEKGGTEPHDFFTDPDKAVKELVAQQVAPIRQKFFERSLRDAEKEHDDFDAAAENFSRLLDQHPALRERWLAEDDPGEFVYLVGSNTPEFRAARESKYRDEMSAKDAKIAALEAEIASVKNAQKAREEVPESLNRQPSGAVPRRDGDSEDINQIVRFKSG